MCSVCVCVQSADRYNVSINIKLCFLFYTPNIVFDLMNPFSKDTDTHMHSIACHTRSKVLGLESHVGKGLSWRGFLCSCRFDHLLQPQYSPSTSCVTGLRLVQSGNKHTSNIGVNIDYSSQNEFHSRIKEYRLFHYVQGNNSEIRKSF